MADDNPRYGVCENGHGDEQGIIAAEVSWAAKDHPNCPICGSRLEHARACLDDHAWCVGPEGPEIDGEAFGGKCSTCYFAGEQRLFVPMNSEPWYRFRDGDKEMELRGAEGQFSEENVKSKKYVELRRGYSTDDSLWGEIGHVQTFDHLEGIHFYNKIVPDVPRAEFIRRIEHDVLGRKDEYIAFEVEPLHDWSGVGE